MAKHTFKQSDVTGDTRGLGRLALGYDWNYLADAETLLFGSTDETAFRMQNMSAGSGFSNGSSIYKANVTYAGDLIKTEILVDLTDLNSGDADGDIIGKVGTANCHIGQITAALNGTIIAGHLECFETPTGGEPDIDVYTATVATGTEDAAITSLTETAVLNAAADWTSLLAPKGFTTVPPANGYLYLVGSGGGTDGVYDAGKFILKMYGYDA